MWVHCLCTVLGLVSGFSEMGRTALLSSLNTWNVGEKGHTPCCSVPVICPLKWFQFHLASGMMSAWWALLSCLPRCLTLALIRSFVIGCCICSYAGFDGSLLSFSLWIGTFSHLGARPLDWGALYTPSDDVHPCVFGSFQSANVGFCSSCPGRGSIFHHSSHSSGVHMLQNIFIVPAFHQGEFPCGLLLNEVSLLTSLTPR